MSSRGNVRDRQMRQLIAQAAARIMSDEGIRDFYAAKRKAAARLSAADTGNMPRNVEVQEALAEYQRLFKADTQPRRLRELRETALQALEFFVQFEARLVGSVLSGTASEHSDVNLHLFADAPEDVSLFLMDEGIPHELGERRLRRATGEFELIPTYRFLAGTITIDLTVFPRERLKHPPLSPVDGKPMRRASVIQLRALMD